MKDEIPSCFNVCTIAKGKWSTIDWLLKSKFTLIGLGSLSLAFGVSLTRFQMLKIVQPLRSVMTSDPDTATLMAWRKHETHRFFWENAAEHYVLQSMLQTCCISKAYWSLETEFVNRRTCDPDARSPRGSLGRHSWGASCFFRVFLEMKSIYLFIYIRVTSLLCQTLCPSQNSLSLRRSISRGVPQQRLRLDLQCILKLPGAGQTSSKCICAPILDGTWLQDQWRGHGMDLART